MYTYYWIVQYDPLVGWPRSYLAFDEGPTFNAIPFAYFKDILTCVVQENPRVKLQLHFGNILIGRYDANDTGIGEESLRVPAVIN